MADLDRAVRKSRLRAGGPMPFHPQHQTPPDTIWRCPICGHLTDEEGSSSCSFCLGEIGDDEGDLWQPYVPEAWETAAKEIAVRGAATSAWVGEAKAGLGAIRDITTSDEIEAIVDGLLDA